MPSTEIVIRCSCGAALEYDQDIHTFDLLLTIDPCEDCVSAAREEAEAEGHERGLKDGEED
jgi:hypothetical protein